MSYRDNQLNRRALHKSVNYCSLFWSSGDLQKKVHEYLWEAFPYDAFDCGGLDDFVCEAKD